METTLGGNRLGSGNKQKIHLKNYERSTHDMSYIWRSTMASGTLVPFLTEVALPGDTFDIDLNCDILTHPTIGPLFGKYKIQLDMFQIPMRLYQAGLHMNKIGIGMNMQNIKLPQLILYGKPIDQTKPIDNQHINPSSIMSYLNIRGLGWTNQPQCQREFNAIPYLGYWDIYKNYYANKQEEIGAVIHSANANTTTITRATVYVNDIAELNLSTDPAFPPYPITTNNTTVFVVEGTNIEENFDTNRIHIYVNKPDDLGVGSWFTTWELKQVFSDIKIDASNNIIYARNIKPNFQGKTEWSYYILEPSTGINEDKEPQITTFPLANIDEMRELILQHPTSSPLQLNKDSLEPYNLPLQFTEAIGGELEYVSILNNQEGLALKTYQSDLFNNWISTEWIEGSNGINEITSVDTTSGSFTIDELNMSKKVYDMLMRIAVSGGSYDDWLDAVYTHERRKSIESPMYLGGLIKELVFQEVISNSQAPEEPLGTLAGRGVIGNKHKGGSITVRIDEPSYIMGIISLTPIIDYSQGNKWDTNLKTMDDLHKPALDEIGFQDLTTDQMAWWDTENNGTEFPIFKSAGKQPAWINYMTNVNQIKGNFADEYQQMYMTLNRRYETNINNSTSEVSIKDLTTYIDPSKFNYIFADSRRDAQNFWAQIGIKMIARRKMSAKLIPNL